MEMTADESKVFNAQKRIITQQEKMIRKLRGVKDESRKAGKQIEMGFGAKATGDLKRMILGIAGVQSAVNLVSKAFQSATEHKQRFLEQSKQSLDSFGKLGQLAGGDPKEFARLAGEARRFQSRAGVTPDQAGPAIFSLISTGLFTKGKRDARDLLADLVGSRTGS